MGLVTVLELVRDRNGIDATCLHAARRAMPRRLRKATFAALIAALAHVSADVVLPSSVTQDQLSMIDAAWTAAGFSGASGGRSMWRPG